MQPSLVPRSLLVLASASLTLLGSCSSIDVSPIREDQADKAEGVVFYPPKLHLAVAKKKDKDGVVSTEMNVIQLPDYAKPHVITWSSGLFGVVQPKFALTDGWMLSSFDGRVESGTSAAVTALAGLVPLAGFVEDAEAPLEPGIYPLEWRDGRLSLGEDILRTGRRSEQR